MRVSVRSLTLCTQYSANMCVSIVSSTECRSEWTQRTTRGVRCCGLDGYNTYPGNLKTIGNVTFTYHENRKFVSTNEIYEVMKFWHDVSSTEISTHCCTVHFREARRGSIVSSALIEALFLSAGTSFIISLTAAITRRRRVRRMPLRAFVPRGFDDFCWVLTCSAEEKVG